MKRIVVSLLIVMLLGSVSLALPAKTAPVKVVYVSNAAKPAMNIGLGVDVGGTPYIRMLLSKGQAVDIGLGFTSTGGAAPASTLALLARYETLLIPVSSTVSTHWGGQLGFQSAAATTTITLTGLMGAEWMINPNIGMYSNVSLLVIQSASAAGASQTNFQILGGNALAYSGFRVYL